MDIEAYKADIKKKMTENGVEDFTRQVVMDMNSRLVTKIPQAD
jgi:hypothetical protein